jgi:hypothetical protein
MSYFENFVTVKIHYNANGIIGSDQGCHLIRYKMEYKKFSMGYICGAREFFSKLKAVL